METTMSMFQEIPSLQTLSLRGVGAFVENVALDIISKCTTDEMEGGRRIFGQYRFLLRPIPRQKTPSVDEKTQKTLDCLKKFLTYHIPHFLYNIVAEEIFRFVERRADKKPSFKEEVVLLKLLEAVLNPELRSIDFREWKSLEISLYENLHNLSGLENLKLSFCTGYLEYVDVKEYLLESLTAMKNLRSLTFRGDCQDVIVETVADHCPALQCLNITLSRSVTTLSIPHLLRCQNLRELKVSGTCIPHDGLAQLIAGLPNLKDIGFCTDFGAVADCLYQEYPTSGPFELREIVALDILDQRRRFQDMFPKVNRVTLVGQRSDLTDLVTLKNLKDLKLLCRTDLGPSFRQLLEVRGGNLTGLHLVNGQNITFEDVFNIGRYCPNLRFLKLSQGDYGKSSMPLCSVYKLHSKPFPILETVHWKGSLTYLRFVLSYATNIRCIDLDSPITHRFVENVLSDNSMSQLEELYIPCTSLFNSSTAELLLANCKNLKIVSKLKSQDNERPGQNTFGCAFSHSVYYINTNY